MKPSTYASHRRIGDSLESLLSFCMLAVLAGAPWVEAGANAADSGPTYVPEISYAVTRLSNRVIVLECLNVNVTAIASDSGIVVIDTNRSRGIMEHLRRVIEEQFGRGDIAYVINTHGDPDHVGGNGAFPGVPLVAHRDFAAYVLHGKASTLHNDRAHRKRLAAARESYQSLDPGSEEGEKLRAWIATLELLATDSAQVRAPRVPALTFADTLRLDLGDLRLELRFCGDAHTNHDILVYVPEERLLLSGDLINSPQSPGFSVNAMADVPKLVGELEGLLRRETGLETVVPGHGPTLSRADLSAFCRSLMERFERVKTENSAAVLMSQALECDAIHAARDRSSAREPNGEGTLYWSEEEFGTLGLRLVRKGMVEEAARVLRKAIDALPESSLLYDCLGDACLENDDAEAAVAAYERSLALMPQNRHAEEMLLILKGLE